MRYDFHMWEPLDVADVRWQLSPADPGDDVLFVASSALHEARLGFCQDGCCQHLLFNHEKGGPGVHVNHTPRKCVCFCNS